MEKLDGRRLGEHLKRLREERKLTLGGVEVLSEGLSGRITKTYLHRVERGKTIPTIPHLRTLAKVYRVRLAMLVEVLETSFEDQDKAAITDKEISEIGFEELRRRGLALEQEGDFFSAAKYYRGALRVAELEVASPEKSIRIAKARHDLSVALRNSGNLELAREQAEAALEENASPEVLDHVRLNLSVIYRRLNHHVLSLHILDGLFDREDKLSKEILGGAYSVRGTVLLNKDPKSAAVAYRAALKVYRALKNPHEQCSALGNIARCEALMGFFSRAHRTLTMAQAIARRKEFNFWAAKFQTQVGITYFLQGKNDNARAALVRANNLARAHDYYVQLFTNYYYLWTMSKIEGDVTSTRRSEASLRFFATRIEDSFEELEEFKAQLENQQEEGE